MINGTFEADHEVLAYSEYLVSPARKSNVLSLHGAGPAGRDRIQYLAKHLLDIDFSTFCFDFSGHGDSTGTLKESSLVRRVEQSRRSLQFIDFETPEVLIGTSMGGHISIELLKFVSPKFLILFCPALYGDDAYDLPFDERFSNSIRRQNSFEDSSLQKVMSNYEGETIIFIGDDDKIIPGRIIEIYEENLSRKGKVHTVRLKGAPHVIHKWALESEGNMVNIIDKVDEVLLSKRSSR